MIQKPVKEVIELPIYYRESHWTVRKQARLQYINRQNGLCYHCKKPLDGEPADEIKEYVMTPSRFPKGMLDNPIHLHHSRKTGLTLGAVHAKCNAHLWEVFGE